MMTKPPLDKGNPIFGHSIKFNNDADQGSAADFLSFSSVLITFCLFGHKLY